jgi:hypothetical protein
MGEREEKATMADHPKGLRNLDGYGTPPYHLHRMEPSVVYAFGTAEPHGATRFDL